MLISTSKHPSKFMVILAKRLSSLLSLTYVGRNKKTILDLVKISFRYGGSRLFILKEPQNKELEGDIKKVKDKESKGQFKNFILDVADLDYNKQVWIWEKRINISIDANLD